MRCLWGLFWQVFTGSQQDWAVQARKSLCLENKQIRNGRTPSRVLEIRETLGIEPDHIGLLRLELYWKHECPSVRFKARFPADLRERLVVHFHHRPAGGPIIFLLKRTWISVVPKTAPLLPAWFLPRPERHFRSWEIALGVGQPRGKMRSARHVVVES